MLRRNLMLGATGAILSPAMSLAQENPFVGPWSGTLVSDVLAHRLRLEFKPDRTAEVLDLDADGLPAKGSVLSQTSKDVAVGFTLINPVNPKATFQGRLVGNRLEGTWTQGPFKLPLVLSRGDPQVGLTGPSIRLQWPL